MGKIEPMQKKLADVGASFATAQTNAPGVRKAIKPIQDTEAAKVSDEIAAMEETLTDKHKKQLRTEPYKYATGPANSYKVLNETALDVRAARSHHAGGGPASRPRLGPSYPPAPRVRACAGLRSGSSTSRRWTG